MEENPPSFSFQSRFSLIIAIIFWFSEGKTLSWREERENQNMQRKASIGNLNRFSHINDNNNNIYYIPPGRTAQWVPLDMPAASISIRSTTKSQRRLICGTSARWKGRRQDSSIPHLRTTPVTFLYSSLWHSKIRLPPTPQKKKKREEEKNRVIKDWNPWNLPPGRWTSDPQAKRRRSVSCAVQQQQKSFRPLNQGFQSFIFNDCGLKYMSETTNNWSTSHYNVMRTDPDNNKVRD